MKPAAKHIGLLLLLFALFVCLGSAEGQQKKAAKEAEKKGKSDKGFGFSASRAPIDITSDTVEASQRENTVVFKGNVIAKQEDTTLQANTLTIHYDGDTKKIREISASGNVKVVQFDRRATGQRATFNQEQNKIVLDGDAVVREGENVIRGERIIFYVDEERSVVQGGKGGRVTTSIVPPPKETEPKKQPSP